jgi:anti-sigma regulatory factor (Ser/Thr protein kinase)
MIQGRVDDVEGVLLCVSELVTNAVMHAATSCEVSVDLDDRRVRVSVRDFAPDRLPIPRELSRTAPAGRGLHILEGCTDRWGVERDTDAKTVWFELELDHAGET